MSFEPGNELFNARLGPRLFVIVTIVRQASGELGAPRRMGRVRRFASVAVRVIAAMALVLLAATPALATPTQDFGKLLSDYDEAQLKLFPSNAVQRNDKRYLGFYEDDLTAAHLALERGLNAEERARLAAIDRGALAPQDRLSYDILGWTLAMRAEEIAPGQGEARQYLPLDQFNGAHLTFAREMEWRSHYPYVTAPDFDRAISRMKGFAHWIDSAVARMREGMAKHIVLPRVIVERMIPQAENFAGENPETSLFMGPLKAMPAAIKASDRGRIAAAWIGTVRGEVLPAYRRLADFLKGDYLPQARASIGCLALPGGRAMYLHDVRSRTTVALSPSAIHALGLSEILRIESEMERVKSEAGFSGTLAEFRSYLRGDRHFKFSNSAEMVSAFERARRIAVAHVAAQFGHLPKASLEIRIYEAFLAPTKSAAEYSPLSADGRRPGIVYLNTYDLPGRPNYTSDVMELHEGIPGHHLQIATAVENAALPPFRRFGGPSAFLEGWAMYAETLGPALGLYTDPYQKFGALAYDAWRASRLVVDTGIHWYGWDEAHAVRFMREHTLLSETEIRSEVERDIAVPAQALAYKIGQREFLALRDKARAALGTKFDIRRFHDALLADGAMPLPILRAKMDRWLAAEKAR